MAGQLLNFRTSTTEIEIPPEMSEESNEEVATAHECFIDNYDLSEPDPSQASTSQSSQKS